MMQANFDGDALNGGRPAFKRENYRPFECTPYIKKTLHKLAQQIFNNKSMAAKNRMRKVARQFAIVTIR